jgi:NADP-dependent 3-hydroxy acid dehydrogenase YdfG
MPEDTRQLETPRVDTNGEVFNVFPSFTKKFHRTKYASIDPTNPYLDHTGKTVLITGAAGIGAETAKAYSKANAARVILISRSVDALHSVKKEIAQDHPHVKVTVASADISDAPRVESIFAEHGPIDIVVHTAAQMEGPNMISQGKWDEFQRSMDVNLKGLWNLAVSFLKHTHLYAKGAERPVFIAMNTCVAQFPAPSMHGVTPASYAVSKVAAAKLLEYISSENPQIRAYNLHPGVVKTKLSNQSATQAGMDVSLLSYDDAEVPAGFCLWLSSPLAGGKYQDLEGKFLWGNWDVDELEERTKKGDLATKGFHGALNVGLMGWGLEFPTEVL